MTDSELIEMAAAARRKAYTPYSRFPVGAALISADGRVFTGCNIENASYGLSMCAERVAIYKAASEGVKNIAKIAVIGEGSGPVSPCGACRQTIWEFSEPDTVVLMANLDGNIKKAKIAKLLPEPFDSSSLKVKR